MARSLVALATVALFAIVAPLGCSSNAASKCGSQTCAAGTDCVDDGSGSGAQCQKACSASKDCPFGSYCNDGTPGHPKSWCAASTTPLTQQAGQWGTPCAPSDGEANNKACDVGDGFVCYGTSPTDANAFCTILGCANDSDCPGAWWCERVDVAPNVRTATRSFGNTRTACLPRAYCATCQMDHDCAPSASGTQQHCVADSAGNGFCSPQCATSDNCPLDAACTREWGVCRKADVVCTSDAGCNRLGAKAQTCLAGTCKVPCVADADCPSADDAPQHCAAGACVPQACSSDDDCPPTRGNPQVFQHCDAGACAPECGAASDCASNETCTPLSVCVPRAGTCVGDGGFCSPCRSDADCKNGDCLVADYSTERFCSQKVSSGTCSTNGPAVGGCPVRPATANYKAVACTTAASALAPANHCIAEVTFGAANGVAQMAAGCWTKNR